MKLIVITGVVSIGIAFFACSKLPEFQKAEIDSKEYSGIIDGKCTIETDSLQLLIDSVAVSTFDHEEQFMTDTISVANHFVKLQVIKCGLCNGDPVKYLIAEMGTGNQ